MASSSSVFEPESLSKINDDGVFFVIGCKVLSLRRRRRRLVRAETRMVKGVPRWILAIMLKPVSVSREATRAPCMGPTHAQFTASSSLDLGKLLLLGSISQDRATRDRSRR